MSAIHLHRTTTATPEQYVAALTDFGPGRSKIFGNSADAYLKVHHRDGSQADVTEGSGGIWERLHYDWSDPNRARRLDRAKALLMQGDRSLVDIALALSFSDQASFTRAFRQATGQAPGQYRQKLGLQ